MMLFHSFAVAMFGASITTLLLFTRRDSRIKADNRATKLLFIGFILSMLEAFSGWMSCQALSQIHAPVFGANFEDGVIIVMWATAMIAAIAAGTRSLHDSLMHDSKITFIK